MAKVQFLCKPTTILRGPQDAIRRVLDHGKSAVQGILMRVSRADTSQNRGTAGAVIPTMTAGLPGQSVT
jgi:TctA family transporter